MMIFLMILHVALINIDEYCFNRKRDHSKYEIASVLVDGILLLIPLLFATFITYSLEREIIYKILGGISMLSIAKNEFFYKNLEVNERFIHACLYVLHPVLLFTFYESWQNNYFQIHPNFWMFQLLYVGIGFKTVTFQLIYWNYIHNK